MSGNNTVTIPVKMGMRGDVSYTVRDSVTGKIKHQRQIKNTLLAPYYLERVFQQSSPGLLGWGNAGMLIGTDPQCRIGSGTTPPTVNDTALAQEQAVFGATDGQNQQSAEGVNPVTKSQLFRFAPGTYVGDVNEVGLSANIAGAQRLVARQLVSPAITLTAVDELDIRWQISLDFGTQVFSGTIPGGQRTGENIDWQLTINDKQMMTWAHRTESLSVSNTGTSLNPMSRIYSTIISPYVRLGDSNAASDLTNDDHYTIKGTELFSDVSDASLKTVDEYVPGSYLRGVNIGFEHDAPDNASVGEMVIGSYNSNLTTQSYGGLCRITFTPALDKATAYRMFIKLVFGLTLDTTT